MDKIDEYLLKEHRVMAGACSSIESLKYLIAREVYLKTIDKVCEWLEDKLDYCEIECYDEKKFINDFKEAMKGGEE